MWENLDRNKSLVYYQRCIEIVKNKDFRYFAYAKSIVEYFCKTVENKTSKTCFFKIKYDTIIKTNYGTNTFNNTLIK